MQHILNGTPHYAYLLDSVSYSMQGFIVFDHLSLNWKCYITNIGYYFCISTVRTVNAKCIITRNVNFELSTVHFRLLKYFQKRKDPRFAYGLVCSPVVAMSVLAIAKKIQGDPGPIIVRSNSMLRTKALKQKKHFACYRTKSEEIKILCLNKYFIKSLTPSNASIFLYCFLVLC